MMNGDDQAHVSLLKKTVKTSEFYCGSLIYHKLVLDDSNFWIRFYNAYLRVFCFENESYAKRDLYYKRFNQAKLIVILKNDEA